MPCGLELYTTNGDLSLEITDRVTTFYASGFVTWVTNNYGERQSVSVPGMSDDGSWMVVIADENELSIYNGGFYVDHFTETIPAYGKQTMYSIYRC